MKNRKRIYRIMKTLSILAMTILSLGIPERIFGDQIETEIGRQNEEEVMAFGWVRYEERERFPYEWLETLTGGMFDPTKLEGKHTLVNIWATWCPYCGQEKKSIQEFHERNMKGDKEVGLVTVSRGEDPDIVQGYMEEGMYTFPVLIDREGKLKEEYAKRIPTTYLVDKEGYIVAYVVGNKDWVSGEAERTIRYMSGER
jgi:thiol-disulfide isomerase/thioredoxin